MLGFYKFHLLSRAANWRTFPIWGASLQNWWSISCLLLKKSGFKRWRKWKLQYDSNSTQAMINVLGWILSCAEFGLPEAEQSQGEQRHRATFPALWSRARQGRPGCLRALKQPKRCFTLCSYRGDLGAANLQPLFSAVLGTALLCSPALLVTLALVTRTPLQLLLLEVKKQSKSEKKYCLLHLHVEGNSSN